MAELFEIGKARIEVERLLAAVADPATGATVLFLGTTRNQNAGRRVTRLVYEAYSTMAKREMRELAREARRRWPIKRVAIAVSAGHRDEAFTACHWLIDRLKEIVPIWKKEHFRGGTVWIGPQQGSPEPPRRLRVNRGG